jgi:gliding motility-associated-like protein
LYKKNKYFFLLAYLCITTHLFVTCLSFKKQNIMKRYCGFFKQRKCLWLIIIALLTIPSKVLSQGKEANIWYFGVHAGIDFNQGNDPVSILGGQTEVGFENEGTASICNYNGQLLFYSDGRTIWNKNHQVMQNGNDVGFYTNQGAVIVPFPKHDGFYFFFNFQTTPSSFDYSFQYSMVDMNLDGGLGGVVSNQKCILLAEHTSAQLTAVNSVNNEGYWILGHKRNNDQYFAYKVTESGLGLTPIFSSVGGVINSVVGNMKVSPDGKKIACSNGSGGNTFVDVLDFDNSTGIVSGINQVPQEYGCIGVEFSPDNTKFYVTNGDLGFFQYDLTAGSPNNIINTRVQIAPPILDGGLQLGPDGKIYMANGGNYLSIINQPNIKGTGCDFQQNSLYLSGNYAGHGLPTFIQSYLNDPVFNFQNQCLGDSTLFSIENTNGIDSVLWAFNIFPNTYTSTDFSPKFRFPKAGNFPVSLTVYSGYLHKTVSKQVKIIPLPVPGLGADIVNCPGTTATLNAVAGYPLYLWNGVAGGSSYIATQAGQYTVQVTDTSGCSGYDTLVFSYYPLSVVDESALHLAPTTCGKETGSITGLQISGQNPLSISWTKNGSPFAATADIYHLGTGLYECKATDGYGCTNSLKAYTISDAGNILIAGALATPELCDAQNGTLSITAVSGLGNMLQYFIKTGNDTYGQWGNGDFTNLVAGTYYAWVSDSSGCSDYYAQPLVIEDMSAPQATATTTPETSAGNDGSITVIAPGTGFIFTLEGFTGNTTGYFTGLASGDYTITISTADGCSSQISVSVGKENGIMLQAIAADGSACLGEIMVAPLVARNFQHVKSFQAKLKYDPSRVICKNYMNVNTAFDTTKLKVELFEYTGELSINYQGDLPVNLTENKTLLELGFTTLSQGQSYLNWDFSPGVCHFVDSAGNSLPAELTKGELRVYSLPRVEINVAGTTCEGDTIKLSAAHLPGTGNGEISYLWQGPAGFTSNEDTVIRTNANQSYSGDYEFTVTDTNQCHNQYPVHIEVIPTPTAHFPTQNDTIYFDEQIKLQANQGYASYLWNTGDTGSSLLISKEGVYSLQMNTSEGCTATESVVMLYAFVPLDMPNAFSPNGDGLNDIFKPITYPEKIRSFSMYIYDRWGMQLFFSNDVSKGWDGTINGSPVQIGGYVYVVKYGNPSGAVREKRGMVMVVR